MRTLTAILALAAAPAWAQVTVQACIDDPRANVPRLAEPLEELTRSYADSAVRVLILGSGEPACCGTNIVVLIRAEEGRNCRLLAPAGDAGGWSAVRFRGDASYDPGTGLTVPLEVDIDEGAGPRPQPLTLSIDRAAGTVSGR